MQFLSKVSSLVHFDCFSSQAWFFCIIRRRFQNDPSKTEVSKCLLNVVYRLKTNKILVPAFYKIAISRKTKFFGTFSLFFSIAWIFGIINQIIQKTQSLKILICSLLQEKYLVITQEKDDGGKDGPFLSFATKCRGQATYDLDVEAISFAIGQGCHRSQLI